MVTTKDFEMGDLVWAKMRGYPFWPAKVVSPPIVKEQVLNSTKEIQKKKSSKPRKGQHYVFFFGSHDCAWILDENIVPHSEEMLNKVSKKKSTSYVKAVEEIVDANYLVVLKPKPVKEDYTERDDLTKNSTAVQKPKDLTKILPLFRSQKA
ncbi:oxidoreductase GLYR1 [Trichonephila inaurata madagascariensis]|uniref:Oxidoreductase GLYR1 n=1 Tax=Trichonephila inaurata madagascariensis TaxID=2747483 RepID=A0A8X6MEN5_9ARAC|nr:oxidoreductase GLYR1 [Trichonephila inaurata madagascariensis]